MALPTSTQTSYSTVGNREDLSDIIFDVSPTETPVLTAIKKTKATSKLHEWQTDTLATASGSNAVLEGDDATTDAFTATVRLNNRCQISDKVPRVTGSQQAHTSAGRSDEMAYQMDKRMKELKRDVETQLLSNTARVTGNATTASVSAGAQTWIKTSTDIASDATASAGDGSDTHTDGTARAMTESMVEGVLSSAWSQGGNPTMGCLNAFQKRKFTGFSGNATRTHDSKDKKIINAIDIYIDPLGNEIRLVPDRYVPADVVFFIDPEYMAFATFRDFQSYDLAKTGDSDRKQILVEYTLEMGNEKAHAGIFDLSAA